MLLLKLKLQWTKQKKIQKKMEAILVKGMFKVESYVVQELIQQMTTKILQ
jgi:hypothetical protein